MLLIGQYFARFPMKKTKKGFASAAVVLIASVAFNVIATYFEYKQSAADYLFFDNRVFLPILLQSVCVFYMVSFVHLSEKASAAVSFVGACTFGIYLISDLNISLLRPLYTALCGGMHPLFAVLIFEICVFAVGLLAVAILKRIPGIQKILS